MMLSRASLRWVSLRKWSAIFIAALALLSGNALFAAPVYPLKASADGRRLVDQNNIPFLMKGEAAWSLVVGMQKADATLYLADRRAKGFNTILIELIEHEFTANPPFNAYGDAPFTKAGDFSTPNEVYFAHADWIINEAAKNDILVLLTPAYIGYACGSQGWCQEMLANGTTKMFNYGVYLANRYRDFKNILWVNAGDADAGAFGASAVVRALAEGIKSVDTTHLHTAHCDRGNSALDCYDEAWLDINNTYTNCDTPATKTKTDYNRVRLMPFFYIEGGYENDGAPDSCIRAQPYTSILGGSTGHVFGNWPIWYFGSGWKSALDSPGAQQMAHLSALFGSRAWQSLVPDYAHLTVTSGYGNINDSSHVAVARSSDGASVIAYLPGASTLTVDMTRIAGTQAKAWWFNPSTGSVTTIGTFATTGSKSFTPPASSDWVLVLDNAALNLPAPGTVNTASADLAITKTAGASTVSVGAALNYTLTVNNQGPDSASAVTVTDTLPAGVTFVSATPSQGTCSQAAGTITCSLTTLVAGAASNIQIAVTTTTAATLTNSASVTAFESDPVSGNNNDSVQTMVTAPTPAPTLIFSASPTSVVRGGSSTLTWSSTGATTCTASDAWTGTKTAAGSQSLTNLTTTQTYTLTCTGAGGSVSQSTTITVTVPPPTLSFSASPISVSTGASSTLTWSSTDASSCTASDGWTGTKLAAGAEVLNSLTTTKTYTLTCTGTGGNIVRSVSVTVVALLPTVTFSASPTSVTSGAASTLTWSSTDASSCTASDGWTGAKLASGSEVLNSLTTTKTYTLTCTGTGGNIVRSVSVTVVAPVPTVILSATPSTVAYNASSTLTWSSTNATSCTASNAWNGSKLTAGSETKTMLVASGTYTLTCSGTGGSTPQSVTLTVTPPNPPAVTLSASAATVAYNTSATLNWSSSDTTSCVASGGWVGSKATSGAEILPTLKLTDTYTLTCTGLGGSLSKSVTINVAPAPLPTVTLTASPLTIVYNAAATLTWSSTAATACTASGAWLGTKTLSGTQSTGALTANASYTLACNGDGGTASASVTVTVQPPPTPLPTVTITATPSSVISGGGSALSWNSTNATSCAASGAWNGLKSSSGTLDLTNLTATGTYTLACTGSGGTATQSATITVTAPLPDVSFSADPASVVSGGSTTLTWSSTDALSCTASGQWSGSKTTSGTQALVNLTSTKTYALACTGAGGTTSKSVSIVVLIPPLPVITFSADPTTVPYNGATTLTWSSSHSTGCAASGDWSGVKMVAGSESISGLTQSKTLTLSCTGPGGVANQSVSIITLAPPEPTLEFSATKTTVALNGTTTLQWSAINATTCSASGAWEGNRAPTGSAVVGPLLKNSTFVLTCTGTGGSIDATLPVTVATDSNGGGNGAGASTANTKIGAGSIDFSMLLYLLLLLGGRLFLHTCHRNSRCATGGTPT